MQVNTKTSGKMSCCMLRLIFAQSAKKFSYFWKINSNASNMSYGSTWQVNMFSFYYT